MEQSPAMNIYLVAIFTPMFGYICYFPGEYRANIDGSTSIGYNG
jgi:hypothetical protein